MNSIPLNRDIVNKITTLLTRYIVGFQTNYREELRSILPPSIIDLGTIVFENIAGTVVTKIKNDSGSIEYICRLCGKKFSSRKGLYLHMRRIHLGDLSDLYIIELKKLLEEYW
ncbi:MAG: C2H2-type zinc finger protein [Sulfolobales archaeon]